MPEEDVRLVVDGRSHTGWSTVRVTRSLEAVAGSFELEISERAADAFSIREGQEAQVRIGSEPLVTGWVDSWSSTISADEHRVTVRGRDRTGELVDCAAIRDPGEWWGLRIEEFTHFISLVYGVSVRVAPGVDTGEPFRHFALQPGETAWEAIERACRLRGLLAVPDGRGDLVLTRPSTERASESLVLGANVHAGTATFDQLERFHTYTVRGQRAGDDDVNGEAAAAVEGVAIDPAIRERRQKVLLAEGEVSPEFAQARAGWEAIVRAARGASLTLELASWRQAGGAIWRPNLLVSVEAAPLRFRGEMLVSQVTLALSEQRGTQASLELVRPDAFVPEPELEVDADPARVQIFDEEVA